MRNQAVIGLFLISIGALLFVYWILIPAKEKQKIINEIYNSSNYSVPLQNVSTPIMQIDHVYLKSRNSKFILAQNYPIGSVLITGKKVYPGFTINTNLFRGSKSYSIIFPGCSNCDGISININSTCDNCNVKIFLNNQQIFAGILPQNFSHYIPTELLRSKNTLKFILNPPANPFVESRLQIRRISLLYLQKEEFIGDFYYYGGDVYLDYNFCPTSPQVVSFYVDNKRIYFPSCSSEVYGSKLYLTPYLREGYNQLKVVSKVPTKVSITLEYTSPKFFYFFKKPKNGIIYLFIVDGEGILRVNNCTYPISPQTTLIDIHKCLMNYNELVIEARPYMDIDRIIIT